MPISRNIKARNYVYVRIEREKENEHRHKLTAVAERPYRVMKTKDTTGVV